ncbi:MAG: PAAR domain-containing protein [Gemmatimonadales bacterium]
MPAIQGGRMSQPAARVSDGHTCPRVEPPGVPHVGGPILPPGAPTVTIEGRPAATAGDRCVCNGPVDMITKGSLTVMINGRPAARLGDPTVHGGVVTGGARTVLVGG